MRPTIVLSHNCNPLFFIFRLSRAASSLAHFEDEEAVVGLDISTAGEVAAAAAANDSEGAIAAWLNVVPPTHLFTLIKAPCLRPPFFFFSC